MKTLTAILCGVAISVLLVLTPFAKADTWTYDFGTTAGSNSFATASSISTVFLPQPSAGGGAEAVRVGSGGGALYLENPGDPSLGLAAELRLAASSNASANKFMIYDYTASKAFSIKFDLKLDGGTDGNMVFVMGDGSSFADGNQLNSAQTFTGLRWTFGASGAITEEYRNGASWSALGTDAFSQGSVYTVEIFGNNTTGALNYNKLGAQSVAADKVDLWVNGVLVRDDLATGELANDANIDSFMFYGVSSTANAAQLRLDNLVYANVIPEPSSLLLVGAGLAGVLALRRRR
jgi:hypothetical protein